MAMIDRVFLTVTMKAQRWSGTNDVLNLTMHSKTGRLLDVDLNIGKQEIPDGNGMLYQRNIPSGETFDSADIDAITLGIRGENLARFSSIVIWGSDGMAHVPLHVFLAIDKATGVAGDPLILSADVVEGSLITLVRPVREAAPNERIKYVIAVTEPRSGMLRTSGFGTEEAVDDPSDLLMHLRIRATDGRFILSEPLPNSNTLPDKQAYVWFFNDFTPFTVADAASYAMRDIPHGEATTNPNVNRTMVIGLTDSGARCLATNIEKSVRSPALEKL